MWTINHSIGIVTRFVGLPGSKRGSDLITDSISVEDPLEFKEKPLDGVRSAQGLELF